MGERGRREHGHQSDARELHRHAEVLRHEDHEEDLLQISVLQERQQRTSALHSSQLGLRDRSLHEEQVANKITEDASIV